MSPTQSSAPQSPGPPLGAAMFGHSRFDQTPFALRSQALTADANLFEKLGACFPKMSLNDDVTRLYGKFYAVGFGVRFLDPKKDTFYGAHICSHMMDVLEEMLNLHMQLSYFREYNYCKETVNMTIRNKHFVFCVAMLDGFICATLFRQNKHETMFTKGRNGIAPANSKVDLNQSFSCSVSCNSTEPSPCTSPIGISNHSLSNYSKETLISSASSASSASPTPVSNFPSCHQNFHFKSSSHLNCYSDPKLSNPRIYSRPSGKKSHKATGSARSLFAIEVIENQSVESSAHTNFSNQSACLNQNLPHDDHVIARSASPKEYHSYKSFLHSQHMFLSSKYSKLNLHEKASFKYPANCIVRQHM